MSDTPLLRDYREAVSFCDLPFVALDQLGQILPHSTSTSSLLDAPEFHFSISPAISAVNTFLFAGNSSPSTSVNTTSTPIIALQPRPTASIAFPGTAQIRFVSDQLLSSPLASSDAIEELCRSGCRLRRIIFFIEEASSSDWDYEPAKMELSDIRKRRGRRAPTLLFSRRPKAGSKSALVGGALAIRVCLGLA
ncbi:hypothetical protein ACJRO7_032550 [Eucalyptus globulus]|uniref:Uncharacterized protein n=1 Tax=Eucalyptus globulus TaxID=34317 RepID=A0ABD3JR15_EUCGL